MTLHESLSFPREQTISDFAAGEASCPVCSRIFRGERVSLASMPEDLQMLILANASETFETGEICDRCASLFSRA